MNCPEARLAIDALLDREIEREEEILLRVHLAECAGCGRELEERRAFSQSVASAFSRAFDGVDPAPGDRSRTAERLAAPRRDRAVPARVAALLVVTVTVGLAAWAVARAKPTAEQVVVAERLGELEAKTGQLEKLREEAGRELDFVRHAAAGMPGEAEAAQALDVAVWNLETRLAPTAAAGDLSRWVADTSSADLKTRGAARAALRSLHPGRLDDLRRTAARTLSCDRKFVDQVAADLESRGRSDPRQEIVVVQTTNGITVKVTQRPDGRVVVTVPGRTVEAADMRDLREKHPEVCREFSISGTDGRVAVGSSAASMDLRGRASLLFRTGGWDEELPFEAYRAWAESSAKDGAEVEKRLKEFRERWRRAGTPALPPVAVDVEAILRNVKALSRQELDKTRERAEAQLRELESRLQEFSDLRGKARGLRQFAEDVLR